MAGVTLMSKSALKTKGDLEGETSAMLRGS